MAYHPFRNLGLKVVSLAIAVLLWMAVAREPIVERSLRVPLQFQNIPENLEIVGETPDTVDVRVRGTSGVVSRLAPGEVVAILDLRSARPGLRLFHLLTEDVQAPFGAQVEHIFPATVPVEFERSGVRVVPVVPAIEGEPAPGFVVGQVTSEPSTVEVAGPESHLRQLTEATTEPVSVAGADEPVQDIVTIGLTDAALRLRSPRTATVSVDVTPAPVERMVPGVTVQPRNLAEKVRAEIQPSMVSVGVRGRGARVQSLRPGDLTAFVDLAGLGPGRYNLPVRTDPLPDLDISRIEPAAIQVRIR